MPVFWDCYIGDENAANFVQLTGCFQPKPRAWPQPILHGSDHVMLDGSQELQRLSFRRKIRVTLPRTTTAIKKALEALFYRFSGGVQLKVTVRIWNDVGSPVTYLCSWATEAPKFEPISDDKVWKIDAADTGERWDVEMNFLIESEL
jgi:hypothetical protein